MRVEPRLEARAWGSLARESVQGGKNPLCAPVTDLDTSTPRGRAFTALSSGFPGENSSNRMLEQWEEHQPPIRSNMCFGVAVSARSGVQLARLGREDRKT